ncbi:hypothetical protein PROFUN_16686, partial [Planoprotostelium fungivorum]
MINHILCLSFLFLLSLSCTVYIDGQNGEDTPSCGSSNSPCKTITNDVKSLSLCLSSGEYEVQEQIPAQMQWTGAGEIPTLLCKPDQQIRSECTNQSTAIEWHNITLRDCSVNQTSCSNVHITSSTFSNTNIQNWNLYSRPRDLNSIHRIDNVTITHCAFHHSLLNFLTSESPLTINGNLFNSSALLLYSVGEITKLNGERIIHFENNIMNAKSALGLNIQSFGTFVTTLNIINNSHTFFLSDDQPTPSRTDFLFFSFIIFEAGDTERASENPIRFNLIENRLPNVTMHCNPSLSVPEFQASDNNISLLSIHWTATPTYPNVNSSIVRFQRNQITSVEISLDNDSGRRFSHTTHFVFHHNFIRVLSLVCPAVSQYTIDFSHNDIMTAVIFKNFIGGPNTNDLLVHNRFKALSLSYSYSSFSSHSESLVITNNTFEVTEFRFLYPYSLTKFRIFLRDNVWNNELQLPNYVTGLKVNSIGCQLYLSNNLFSNFSGGAVILSAEKSHFFFDRISVKGCNGGISISSVLGIIHINNSDISHNAEQSEGGLALYGSLSNVTIYNCTLYNNESPHGSAISSSMKMSHINFNITDYSVVVISGPCETGNNSMTCGEERYMDVSESAAFLMWSCRPCENGKYIIGGGRMEREEKSGIECKLCPAGASCQSGLTPQAKGRYWCGVNNREELQCLLCPSDYCKKESHDWHNSCLGNREGVLCGTCAANYTLGFFTSSCLPTSECKSQWMALFCIIPIFYFIILVLLPIGDGSIWKSTSYFIQTVPLLISQGQRDQVISILASIFFNPSATTGLFRGVCIGQVDYVEMQMLSLYIPLATLFVLSLACIFIFIYHRVQERWTSSRRSYQALVMLEYINGDTELESGTTGVGEKRTVMSRCTAGLITAFLLIYGGLVSTCLKLLFC